MKARSRVLRWTTVIGAAAVVLIAATVAAAPALATLAGRGVPSAATMKAMSPPNRKMITNADRIAAAKRLAAAQKANPLVALSKGLFAQAQKAIGFGPMAPLGTPDYFGTTPNYANSPLPTLDASGNPVAGTGIRKFVDSLPGLGAGNANDLGNYLPVATPNTTSFPGSDYYVIGLVRYTEKLHKDLPATTLQGYVQLDNSGTTQLTPPSYLGPTIIAQKDRPVRVKFINQLPTNAGGNLYLPVDTTVMGAGTGPTGAMYSQNRATLHLHGGATPWISDGTPHQWTTPAGENTPYPKGVSVSYVPDMWFDASGALVPTGSANATNNPGPGALTFYYTNQQSARLMFYHDHAYGITRLNVYGGEAAGYVLQDPVEKALTDGGAISVPGSGTVTVAPSTVPTEQIPLIIQDKTFVPGPSQLASEDPTWDTAHWGGLGNLWFPHVYMPNQNPTDAQGANACGRWDYGPWFWPPSVPASGTVPNPLAGTTIEEGPVNPGTPNPSLTPEAFMDTPLVNGTPYPFLKVSRKAYRFRILNASNDRTLNLQLYYAASNTPDATDPITGLPTLQKASGEVTMVVAAPHSGSPTWPASWPTDGRDGGVPDPASSGPKMIQIGTEGGFLPAPVTLTNQPVGYNYNRRDITVLNVSDKTLMLGPAERADIIVDFSQVPAGSKLILYNDSPAPVPAFDSRNDYYTGDPDQTNTGGAPTTVAGYGPNTRTVMQFQVGAGNAAPAFDTTALATGLSAAYKATQDPPIVQEKAYGYPADHYVRIQDTTVTVNSTGTASPIVLTMERKAIQELFTADYGRMNATLGIELPKTTILTQTTIPYGYIDPPTEIIQDSSAAGTQLATLNDGTQIWKITHNGVDTHAIHFHLFNVQLINRVGWDGMVKPPDPNELGWKDTVRMNPLEDAIVALRPIAPKLPWKLGDSIRPLDPTMPLGSLMGFTNVDPSGNPTTTVNAMTDFGWEYVWHCHLLGHEENDMMRPVVFDAAPAVPSGLTTSVAGLAVTLTWVDNSTVPTATMFTVQRSTDPGFANNLVTFTTAGPVTHLTDSSGGTGTTYYYRVRAENAVAYSQWSAPVTAGTMNRYEQTDTKLAYSGAWTEYATAEDSAGSYRYLDSEGTVTATFSGTAVDWITTKGYLYGKATVTVDGGSPVTVDLYDPGWLPQSNVWSATGLSAGTHTLTIAWTGTKNASSFGTYIGLDALDIAGTLLQAVNRFEQTDSRLGYTGAWTQYATAEDSAGSYRYLDSAGTMTATFSGTSIDWITTKGYLYGKATVTVDGGSPTTVDLYDPGWLPQSKVWSATGLSWGVTHTVTIAWTGTKNASSFGTYIGLDALDIAGTLIQSKTRFEQTDSRLAYTGAWTEYATAEDSAGSYRYLNSAGSVTATFSGTSIDWITTKGYLYGKATVTVDGGSPVTVDLYDPGWLPQSNVWSATGLSAGTHTLTISWTGTKNASSFGTYIGLDAFDINGTLQ